MSEGIRPSERVGYRELCLFELRRIYPTIRSNRKSKNLVGIRNEPWEISNCHHLFLFLALKISIIFIPIINRKKNKTKLKFLVLVSVSINVTKEISCIQKYVVDLCASRVSIERAKIRPLFAEKIVVLCMWHLSLSEKNSLNTAVWSCYPFHTYLTANTQPFVLTDITVQK